MLFGFECSKWNENYWGEEKVSIWAAKKGNNLEIEYANHTPQIWSMKDL